MADRFDGGDESRVQALMAENSALRTAIARLFEYIHDSEHFGVPMDECHQCAAVEASFMESADA